MWWPFQWIVIYILGGLTFVPLVLALTIGYVLKYGSVPIGDPDPRKREKAGIQARQEREELLEREKDRAATSKPLSGWLTVRRQFHAVNQASSIFLPNTTTTGDGVRSESPDIAPTNGNGNGNGEKDDSSLNSGTSTPNTSTTPSNASTAASIVAPTTYSARIAQTYRQVMEARQKNTTAPKEYFFCVLKGSVLFLYEDEAQSDCVAAICIDKYIVGVENQEGGRFQGKDAEMFAKRNAVVMRLVEGRQGKNGLPALSKGMSSEESRDEEKELEGAPWFFFSKSNIKMEDWYIALTQASALRPTTDDVFSEKDMQALVDTIDTEPDPIPMRWLNAMVGRMFFGVYRTEALEQFIIGKIMKKLSKVPRPSFLGPIVIREAAADRRFSKPMLKDLTAEGTASFEVHLNYRSRPQQPNSEVRITIATTATIPTGFKPYVVDLVLAVVLRSMEGNMVMQIKKPPSNRFWYGFTHMPKMEVEIQPIVSERKIQIGMVLKAIEKQLREVIAESVVLPNMDDIAFFDTSALDIRGGIFSSAGKVVDPPTVDLSSGGIETPTQPGVEIGTSSGAASSATGEGGQVRQRRPTKSQTYDSHGKPIPPMSTKDDEPQVGISRVDTAPALLKSTNDSAKAPSTAVQATKRWFATTAATNRPPSVASVDTLKRGASLSRTSVETTRSLSAEQRVERPKSMVDSLPEASSSDPELAKGTKEAIPAAVNASAPRSVKVQTGFHDLAKTTTDSQLSSSAETAAPASPTGSMASTTTASLITSLRARDKQAIQSQVNTARDAVKKWGVSFAAKRRNFAGRMDEAEDQPAAVYRPPDEDVYNAATSSTTLSKSAEGNKTLQERLNAAAATANRPKSGSVSSTTSPSRGTGLRPSLQPSPSKSSVSSFGSSPPQWTLSTAAPTLGVEKADVAARPGVASSQPAQTQLGKVNDKAASVGSSGQRHERRGSTSNPVLTQPMAGRSMVVPRVPKRPGQVIGIGSSETGITRRISGSEDEVERPVVKPNLPPRQSGEVEREQEEVLRDKPFPPPKLRTRKASPTPPEDLPEADTTATPLTTGSAIDDRPALSGKAAPPEASEIQRSDSAPPASTVPSVLPAAELEAQENTSESPTSHHEADDPLGTQMADDQDAAAPGAAAQAETVPAVAGMDDGALREEMSSRTAEDSLRDVVKKEDVPERA